MTFRLFILKCIAGLLAVFFILFPSKRVMASVITSPHDLFRQGYLQVSEERIRSNPQCDQCHITSSEDRPQIWKVLPPSLAELGETGILCASCHDGISIMDMNVDAGLTVFHPLSHGLDPSHIPSEIISGGTGLPPLEGSFFSCLTCHDPHEQTIRPFLRVPIEGLCTRCHQERQAGGTGILNTTGDHPVNMEPFDKTGSPSPITVQHFFSVPFPKYYPQENGMQSTNTHWISGGHLGFGNFGTVQCTTCHALHGSEPDGPQENLLAKDPVREVSDEFCEGCHMGERGDEKDEPPFPNPGGTKTGRTYHPADDDEANDIGWNVAIADTVEIEGYIWGEKDPDENMPRILCTTCHSAHNGMENSPGLVKISEVIKSKNSEITTFCEICHREAPSNHHAYKSPNKTATISTGATILNTENLGQTFGSPEPGMIYCSLCHKAHNAGYNRDESLFIPILVEQSTKLCELCHIMGVSHFLGDPTLPSTYASENPPLKRTPWPSGLLSIYEGIGESLNTLNCLSCHTLQQTEDLEQAIPHLLLAPAGEAAEWSTGNPDEYLCTGCHGDEPSTAGEGITHPLMSADATRYPEIRTVNLLPDEIPVTYSENGKVNCHSCHVSHNAIVRGGVYILKICRGENQDPKAIRPLVHYSELCDSCHPYL